MTIQGLCGYCGHSRSVHSSEGCNTGCGCGAFVPRVPSVLVSVRRADLEKIGHCLRTTFGESMCPACFWGEGHEPGCWIGDALKD